MCLAKQIITLIPSRPNFNEEVIISQIPNKVDFVSTLDNIKPKGRALKNYRNMLRNRLCQKKLIIIIKNLVEQLLTKLPQRMTFL